MLDANDARPSQRRGIETRNAIDSAAIQLFAQLGYHATPMRSIAAAANVQPAAIYHWYSSKEAILVQLQDDFMEQLNAAVAAAVGRHSRPADRLAAAIRAHVVFHGVHTQEAFVTDSEIRALTDAPRKGLVAKRDEYQRMFNEMIIAGNDDGSFDIEQTRVATYAILLQCTGVALWFKPTGLLTLDEVADLHVELSLSALHASRDTVADALAAVRLVAS